jgi:uncharacterized membrane protein YqjE
MEQTAGGTQPPAAQEPSVSELVKHLSEQVSVLVRDELKLAQLEMTRKGKQAGLGVGMFGGSGVAAFYAVGCLLACAILAISRALEPWLAALIVGVALLVISAIAALLGRARLRKATPPVPKQAVDSVKADVNEIKESAHR